jgi:tape measure domain-containing protein
VADNLQIEIDVNAAREALKSLTQSFTTFQAEATTQVSGVSKVISRLNAQMRNIQAMNPAALSSLTQFNQAVANLQTGNLTAVADAMSRFNGTAGGIQTSADAVKTLSTHLQGLQAPAGVERMSVSFRGMGSAAQTTSAQTKALGAAQREIARDIQNIGREVINTAGYMLNMGVTVGNLGSALTNLSKNGQSAAQVFGLLQEKFGKLGAAGIALGAATMALKGLYSAASAVIEPLIRIGTVFDNFKLAIDAIDGSGAGAKTLTELQGIASRTAMDIEVLAKNFVGFRAAAESSGMTMDQTLRIYEGMSVGLRALGADSMRTEKAMIALTQMMSKGKVMAEELKNQLGDALPGAVTYAAQAMGKTTSELQAMMESGNLLARDFLPKLAEFMQTKFGDAVARQAKTAQGQISLLANNIKTLQATVASGFSGGVMQGFARGMMEVNDALASSTIKAFAAAVGELMGIITAIVTGAFGGFIQGLTAIGDLVGGLISLYKPFGEVLSSISAFLEKNAVVMGLVAGAAKALGASLGILAGGYVTLKVGTLAVAAATGLWQAALGRSTTTQVAAAAAATTTATAMGATTAATATAGAAAGAASGMFAKLNAAMKANLAVVIASAIAGIAITVWDLIGGLKGLTDLWGKLTGSQTAAVQSTTTLQTTLQKLVDTAAKTPEVLADNALKYFDFSEAQKRAKQETEMLDMQLKEHNDAMKESQRAMEEDKRARQESINSLKGEKDALQARISSIKEADKAFRGSAGSTSALGIEASRLQDRLNGLNADIKGATTDLERWSLQQKDAAGTSDALGQRLKEQRESMKQWGVGLTDAGVELAKTMMQFGRTKDEAAQLAYGIEQATRSFADLGNEMENQSKRQNSFADFLDKQVKAIEDNVKSQKDQVRQTGESIKMSDRYGASMSVMAEKLKGMSAELRTQAAINEAVGKAMQGQGDYITNLDGAIDGLTDKYGLNIDKTKFQEMATKQLSERLKEQFSVVDKAAESTEKLGDKAKTTAEKMAETEKATKAAAENAETVAKAMDNSSGSFEKANGVLGTIAGSMKVFADSVSSTGLSLPPTQASLDVFSDSVVRLSESLPSTNESLAGFNAQITPLSTQLPIIAPALASMAQSLISAAEPTAVFSAALAKIPETAPGIDAARTAMEQMVVYLRDAQPDFETAVKNLSALAETGTPVKAGFEAAVAGGSAFVDTLDSILSALNTVIQRMVDLKQAAEEALKAAQAASNSGGGGGNEGQREGGYSEENLYKSSAITGSKHLTNAPQFAEGTSNTSRYLSKLPGGGIPSILHPNEAVIPLSKGRKVPVDLKLDPVVVDSSTTLDTRPFEQIAQGLNNLNSTIERGLTTTTSPTVSQSQDLTAPTVNVTNKIEWPGVQPIFAGDGYGTFGNPADLSMHGSSGGTNMGGSTSNNTGTSGGDSSGGPSSVTINIDINLGNVQDVDGFRRSEDQIVRSLAEKIKRATRRVQ